MAAFANKINHSPLGFTLGLILIGALFTTNFAPVGPKSGERARASSSFHATGHQGRNIPARHTNELLDERIEEEFRLAAKDAARDVIHGHESDSSDEIKFHTVHPAFINHTIPSPHLVALKSTLLLC